MAPSRPSRRGQGEASEGGGGGGGRESRHRRGASSASASAAEDAPARSPRATRGSAAASSTATGGRATKDRSNGRRGAAAASSSSSSSSKKRRRAGSESEEVDGDAGRKRRRTTVLSYKESVLAKLTAAKAKKEAELAAATAAAGGDKKAGAVPSSLPPTAPAQQAKAPGGAAGAGGGARGNGPSADEDDTPPLILKGPASGAAAAAATGAATAPPKAPVPPPPGASAAAPPRPPLPGGPPQVLPGRGPPAPLQHPPSPSGPPRPPGGQQQQQQQPPPSPQAPRGPPGPMARPPMPGGAPPRLPVHTGPPLVLTMNPLQVGQAVVPSAVQNLNQQAMDHMIQTQQLVRHPGGGLTVGTGLALAQQRYLQAQQQAAAAQAAAAAAAGARGLPVPPSATGAGPRPPVSPVKPPGTLPPPTLPPPASAGQQPPRGAVPPTQPPRIPTAGGGGGGGAVPPQPQPPRPPLPPQAGQAPPPPQAASAAATKPPGQQQPQAPPPHAPAQAKAVPPPTAATSPSKAAAPEGGAAPASSSTSTPTPMAPAGPPAPPPGPPPKATVERAVVVKPSRPPLATVLGGMKQRPGLLSQVSPFVVKVSAAPTDAEVEPLLARRKALLEALSSGKGVAGVLSKPALLPAPRRKTHWDYLLEEMAWMATDFHEERKWKKAAGGLMSRAAASEARRRVARERGVGEETSRICHRLSTGVLGFWRAVSSQIRYYNDSSVALQREHESAKAAAAEAEATEDSSEESEKDEDEDEEEEDEDAMDTDDAEKKKKEKAAPASPKRPEMTEAEVLRLRESVKQCVNAAQEVTKAEHLKVKTPSQPQPPGDGPPLLPHQLVAFRWLNQLSERKYGAILADSPGMGKTVVVVRTMVDVATTLKRGGSGGAAATTTPPPQLLVVPAYSVVRWRTELAVHGKGLSVILVEEWGAAMRSTKASAAKHADVVLCSSAALGSPDAARLPDYQWSNLVLDLREQVSPTTAAATAAAAMVGLPTSASSASLTSDKKAAAAAAAAKGGEEDDKSTASNNGEQQDSEAEEEDEATAPVTEWAKVAKLASQLAAKADRRVLVTEEGVSKEKKDLQRSAAWLSFVLPHVFASAEDVMTWAPKAAASLANATFAAQAAAAANSGANVPPPAKPEPPATSEYVGRIVRGFQLQRARSQADGGRGEPTEVSVVRCPMPALQEKEYQRIQSATGGGTRTKAAAADAGEVAARLLASRFACMHADLAFWYRGGASAGEQPLMSQYLPAGALSLAVAGGGTSTRSSKSSSAASASSAAGGGEVYSAWDDASLFSQHNSLSNCVENSGKFAGLLKLLRQFDGQGKKVVLLASLPQALALIHTYLTAADVPHDFCPATPPSSSSSSSFSSSAGIPSWLQTQLTIARFNLSSTSLQATTRILVAPINACLGRGGLAPSATDVAVVLDDEWSVEGRATLHEALERMSMRSKAFKVFRLVTQGTLEEKLWPSTLPPPTGGAAKNDHLALVAGVRLSQAQAGMEDGVEKKLREKERVLAGMGGKGSSKKEDSLRGSGELCRECFSGKSLGAYGKRFLHLMTASTEGEKGGPAPRGPSPTEGLSLMMMEEAGSFAASDAVIHDAVRALVKEVPGGATNAQALLEHSTAMRALGIEMDMTIAAPPLPPSDPTLTELVEFPSWADDPVTFDLGLVVKYVSLVETVSTQQRRKKLMEQRRQQLPQGRGEGDAGGGGGPVNLRLPNRPRVDFPTDWSTEEDQELLWAFETYGRNPLIIPFVLNKKTPPYVKKRSSKQCLDRIDALLNQGAHAQAPRIARPAHALPSFRGRVLPIRDALLDTPWTPPVILPSRKSPRQTAAVPAGAEAAAVATVPLPGPDHDATSRLSKSFVELSKVQNRLRQGTPLPDGKLPPSATPAITPENVPLNQAVSALNILETMKKAAAAAAQQQQQQLLAPVPGGLPRQPGASAAPAAAGLAPPVPQAPVFGAGGVLNGPPPPPPSTLVNVAHLNPSLAPSAGLSPLGPGSTFGLGGGRGMQGMGHGGAGRGGVKGNARKGGGGMGGMGGMKVKGGRRTVPGGNQPVPRGLGQGGSSASLATAGGGGMPMQQGGGGGGNPGGMVKAPTVTLPANMQHPSQQPGMMGGGGGGPGGVKRPPMARPGGPGGAQPANQVYMNQLMSLIQRRPDLKSHITQILGRQDLNDGQRIEYIGEILKAANLAPGGGGGGGGGGGAVPVPQQQQQMQQQMQMQQQQQRPPQPPQPGMQGPPRPMPHPQHPQQQPQPAGLMPGQQPMPMQMASPHPQQPQLPPQHMQQQQPPRPPHPQQPPPPPPPPPHPPATS